jgi:hypothetical protein
MVHRLAGDSYPSAGINRIRFIGLRLGRLSQPAIGHPVERAREWARRDGKSRGPDLPQSEGLVASDSPGKPASSKAIINKLALDSGIAYSGSIGNGSVHGSIVDSVE